MYIIAKNIGVVDALNRAGYDTKIIAEAVNGGFAVFVDLDLSPSDGPAWAHALKKEVKSIINSGRSHWA